MEARLIENACLESNAGNSSSGNVVAQAEQLSEGEAEVRFKGNGKKPNEGNMMIEKKLAIVAEREGDGAQQCSELGAKHPIRYPDILWNFT